MTPSLQEWFDQRFITSSEICKNLRITRGSIRNAKASGFLPEPAIVVNGVGIWERNAIAHILEAWKNRRGITNG